MKGLINFNAPMLLIETVFHRSQSHNGARIRRLRASARKLGSNTALSEASKNLAASLHCGYVAGQTVVESVSWLRIKDPSDLNAYALWWIFPILRPGSGFSQTKVDIALHGRSTLSDCAASLEQLKNYVSVN